MGAVPRDDIVVAWAIIEDADDATHEPEAAPEPVPVSMLELAGVEHCPACGSHGLEITISGLEPEVECQSCARVWTVGLEGLLFRERRVVEHRVD